MTTNTAETVEAVACFHVSLTVTDLAQSVAFYRALFGVEPAKSYSDYAKFEIDTPPLVLSLMPGQPAPGGTLNHVGLRVVSSEELVKIQHRLETSGFRTQREDGVECCYARQTKFWVTDPDRTLWELYVFHEDIDEHGNGSAPDPSLIASCSENAARPKLHWQHSLSDPVPILIPLDDNSVDDVYLKGTINLHPAAADIEVLLREVHRVLRPGGVVRLHGLAGSRPSEGASLSLPGPAAAVQYVPVENESLKALLQAGFFGAQYEKFSPQAYFNVDGVEMREILIAAVKPGHRPRTTKHIAIYQGPLATVTDDFGNVYPRGARVLINVHDWLALKNSSVGAQFLLLVPEGISLKVL